MKITVLSDGITPFVVGGMQRHTCNMVRALANLGVDIDLYHVLPGEFDTEDIAQAFTSGQWDRIRSCHFRWPRCGRLPGHYARESFQLSSDYLRHYTSRPAPDVIYAKGLMAHAFLRARRDLTNSFPPIVTNAHGYEMYQRPADRVESLKRWILRPGIRFVSRSSDYVASYGGGITDILTRQLGVARNRILEISGAIDESWLAPALHERKNNTGTMTKSPIRFGFLGRYERRKGVEELAAVFEMIDMQSCELHLIGSIPRDKQRRFPQTTVFHGQLSGREEICRLLDTIDVLIVPSWSEGMPNVIMEAMARNTAIIATDVGAVGCLVDSSTGWLVPAGDVLAFRDAVIAAIRSQPDELLQRKVNCHQRIADQFTWPHVGAQLHQALTRVIGSCEIVTA